MEKQLNDECLSSTMKFPSVFTRAAHNFAKMVALMYRCEDNNDKHENIIGLDDHIKSMLFESIPI